MTADETAELEHVGFVSVDFERATTTPEICDLILRERGRVRDACALEADALRAEVERWTERVRVLEDRLSAIRIMCG